MPPSAILPHVLSAQHGHPSQIQSPLFLTIDQNSLSVKSPYHHGYIPPPHMVQPPLSPDLSILPTHRGSARSQDDLPDTHLLRICQRYNQRRIAPYPLI